MLLFSTTLTAQNNIISNGDEISGLSQKSWGQSFVTTANATIESISFNSATSANNFTLKIFDGPSCSFSLLHTQNISQIVDGNNVIFLNSEVDLVANKTYYFSIESNTTNWRIRFNPMSQVSGNLTTYYFDQPQSACNWNFPNFDWVFSINFKKKPFTLPSNPIVDLFILAGQSNAQGWRAEGAQYPYNIIDEQIPLKYNFYYGGLSSNGQWIQMQPQSGLSPTGHFGPEVIFSRKLLQNNYHPYIFKFTSGGTSIYQHWKLPGQGGMYDAMVDDLKLTIADLVTKGYTVKIRGLVWIQGESDADTPQTAADYYNNLKKILLDFRTNVTKNECLPIVIGLDEQHPSVVANTEVLKAQQKLAQEDANIQFTSMLGLPKADGTHLTSAGVILQGERIYNDYLQIVPNASFEVYCPVGSNPHSSTIISDGDYISGLNQLSWGQSFVPTANVKLKNITFNSATNGSNFVMKIYDGPDCGSPILHSQNLPNIINGDNSVTINSSVNLVGGKTYYFSVESIDNTPFQIRFGSNSQVMGNLKTYLPDHNKNTCLRDFPTYDWKFSISCINVATGKYSTLTSEKPIENLNQKLQIYPNPATNILCINNISDLDITQVHVFSSSGREINVPIEKINNTIRISLESINSGLYIVKLKDIDFKFIKK